MRIAGTGLKLASRRCVAGVSGKNSRHLPTLKDGPVRRAGVLRYNPHDVQRTCVCRKCKADEVGNGTHRLIVLSRSSARSAARPNSSIAPWVTVCKIIVDNLTKVTHNIPGTRRYPDLSAISPLQQQIAAALASGARIAFAARDAEIARQTVNNWLRDLAFS